MLNAPEVKIGIVAVSRDCFPESLSVNRRKALVDAYKAKYGEADIYECPVCGKITDNGKKTFFLPDDILLGLVYVF